MAVLQSLKEKADIFNRNRDHTWFVLFSKSGYTQSVIEEAEKDEYLILIDIVTLMTSC